MLFAPTAAKHDLTAPAAVGGLKKSNCGDAAVAKKKHQAAALLTNGLRHFNHQQSQQQQQHRQHHNQHQQQQQQQQQQQRQQSQDDLKVKQQQHQQQQQQQQLQLQQQRDSRRRNFHQYHVPNSARNDQQQQQQQQQQLAMDAMKKLDAKLVAYLAGEQLLASRVGQKIEEQEVEQLPVDLGSSTLPLSDVAVLPNGFGQLNVFKRISGIKLQMEALTLQPEGTKRMELLQNDTRPIFTVECQLSHDLIKDVPRYDMFHVMQFESEKFQSLTQCTRFGQEAQRAVMLDFTADAINNNSYEQNNGAGCGKPNLGRIHFTVWWREPGTCFNEMLGMGVLALEELYAASVLEQCKNIVVQRRNVHLANLYFKISLQIGAESETVPSAASAAAAAAAASDATDGTNNFVVADSTANASDAAQSDQKSSSTGSDSSNSNDNNVQIETTHFIAETSRVRLLRGLICASEVRQLDLHENRDYLVCRRFWEDDLAVTTAGADNQFNYQEQFAVLNDDAFLRRVERQHLQLELWRRQSATGTDGNGNGNGNNGATRVDDIRPLGVVRLPLHQFFIAYRDVAITNHLCKGKLPVISFDAWAPITSFAESGTPIGELRCMLAIGSDDQIAQLKEMHGYSGENSDLREIDVDKKCFLQRPPLVTSTPIAAAPAHAQLRSTSSLLEFLQRSLTAQPPIAAPPPPRMPPELDATPPTAAAPAARAVTANAPPSLLKPLQMPNVKSFRFLLEIQCANGLPRNPAARGKKSSKRNSSNKQQRFPPNEAPSTYVTFQADEGHGPVYKSHEGAVYATNIVEKSTQPQWQQRFRISTSVDYLLNPQKRFILKIWKKAATDSPQKRQQPTPLDDAIVGFAALDLGVFLRGLYIAGCFNIVDFNGRINGQLEVRSQPLEDLQQLLCVNRGTTSSLHQPTTAAAALGGASTSGRVNIDSFIDEFDSSLDLAHLNLDHAIKRKFSELEDISQRLRTRLADVTGEQLTPRFNASLLDNWQTETNETDVSFELDEFEHDISTPPPEASTSDDNGNDNDNNADDDDDNDNDYDDDEDNGNNDKAAQNDKAQFKIASIASASICIERNDASKSMTPKE